MINNYYVTKIINHIEMFKLNNKITWLWVNEYKQNDKKHLQGLHSSGTPAVGILPIGGSPSGEHEPISLMYILKTN